MNHRDIRQTFLDFYAERGHKIVPSSSLIPKDDPTLLFTSAGMVQFKPYYAGTVPVPYRRATSIQKCLRATDLEAVGKSIKYCTFFEMLGNFSFGDYFKQEAIPWAWEYLTEVVRLPKERLYVSVYEEDDEAYEIWHKDVGLAAERIYRLGADNNFWGPAGLVGACGPCSEIYYDLGEEFGCKKPNCGPGCDCERYLELYNIVFPQYDKQLDGRLLPLKNRGIDTGMGLERLAMVSQGKRTIFETDLFAPLVRRLSKILDRPITPETKVAFYAAVDHARALTFAIGDGALPSNEGRGYVLRSILRRALLFAYKIGITEPFLYRLAGEVIAEMRQWYPEYKEKQETIALVIKTEEERFLKTLASGLERFNELLENYRESKIIPGIEAFRLHDTFGFHIELSQELAKEAGYEVDVLGFEAEMQKQKERSKKVVIDTNQAFTETEEEALARAALEFYGYDTTELETNLLLVRKLSSNEYEVLLERTPFYAQGGGQVGDTGKIIGEGFELEIIDSYYKAQRRFSKARLVRGELKDGVYLAQPIVVKAIVDLERRREIERAHTATHLLHSALRQVLGEFTKQEGSLVEPGRLRFDFRAPAPLTKEQLNKIEELVNRKVLEDLKVEHLRNLPIEEAQKLGALAFFGEAYGERVNVIKIGNFSCEFCGGTHLRRTGEIGLFKIISEEAVAAGIRRITAYVGLKAYLETKRVGALLDEVLSVLKVPEERLVRRLGELLAEKAALEKRLAELSQKHLKAIAQELLAKGEAYLGLKLIVAQVSGYETNDLRIMADELRARLKEKLVALLLSESASGVRFVIAVSDDLRATLPAKTLAQKFGAALGGFGGGREHLAEGGGKEKPSGDFGPIIKEIIAASIEKNSDPSATNN